MNDKDGDQESDRFEDLPPETQDRIATSLDALLRFAFRYSAAITIGMPPGESDEDKINSASSVVILHKGSHFLLTAAHVVSDMIEPRIQTRPGVQLQVGNARVSTDGFRLGSSTDVAVLPLPDETALEIGTLVYETGSNWPPDPPQPGDYVVIAGYPKFLRSGPDENVIDYGCLVTRISVTTAGEGYVACQFERQHWIDASGTGIQDPGTPLGGISGGPVLLQRALDFPLAAVASQFVEQWELLRLATFDEVLGLLG